MQNLFQILYYNIYLLYQKFIFLILISIMFYPALFAQEDYQVRSIKFEGNVTFSDEKLLEQVSMHTIGFIRRNIFRKKPIIFSQELLESDVKKLIYFYQSEGFLSVKIPEPEVELDSEKGIVYICFSINEGEPVLIGKVSAIFNSVSVSERELVQEIFEDYLPDLNLSPTKRFQDRSLRDDKIALINKYNDSGYPYVAIDYDLKVFESESEVNITWHIRPGPRCFFGDINVFGNQRIQTDIIIKQITFERGQLFQQSLLEKTQSRIFALGLFRVAVVKVILTAQQDSIIPVQIQIREAPGYTVKFGVGYGREDQFRVFSNSRRLGVFNSIWRLDLLLKHSGLEPYNIDLRFTQPVFFSYKTALTLNPFLRKEDEPGYTIRRIGGRVSVLHQINAKLKSSVTYLYEKVTQDTSSIDPDRYKELKGEELYDKSGPILGLTWDSSRPIFSPSSGTFVTLSLKTNGLIIYTDFRYNRLLLDFRQYREYRGTVVAYRLKIGAIKSFDEQGFVPVEDRFYAGGSTSVRGWGRQQLGPKDVNDDPIGGKSLFEGSIEWRESIIRSLAGVIFMDFGNVWIPSTTYPLNELRYAFGLGIGIDSPIGPIRIDVGKPIFDEEKKIQIHLNIGHAF